MAAAADAASTRWYRAFDAGYERAGIDDVHIESLRGTGYYLVIDALAHRAADEIGALAA